MEVPPYSRMLRQLSIWKYPPPPLLMDVEEIQYMEVPPIFTDVEAIQYIKVPPPPNSRMLRQFSNGITPPPLLMDVEAIQYMEVRPPYSRMLRQFSI